MSKQRLRVHTDVSILKSQLRKDEKFFQGVRLYAVYQIAKGRSAEELEELYNVSHKSVCNWVHRYNSEGLQGLIDRLRAGRPSRLNQGQQDALRRAVSGSPEKQGYSSETWTGAMLILYIEKTFGVSYKQAQIYNLLHKLGFGFQRGRAVYPESEEREEKVQAIKKTSRKTTPECGCF
ncbi:hypothetical protein EZS27_023213 [termite gut metagenome]|uniref:Uncharacterized protein n=1 Tax=termite gut metagenome TaxID=433724 RepID=A0A5J4R5K3_9ZZZZ